MLAFISERLGRRDLIWGGLRSDDIESISDLEQVAGSFSIIGGHDRGGAVPSLDFEDLSGVREDLDSWDIEDHLDTPQAREFREALLNRLAGPSALLPYRPSNFLSAILFARRDRCLDLGLFAAHQALFEHKPWVETKIGDLGVPRVPWIYVADEEQRRVQQMLRAGPIMLRVSRSSGGAGLVRVDAPSELSVRWPHRPEAFVGVTPFLEGALPLNISGTVWHDGVTMNHLSVQLIGIPSCATRPFGYCGNDFGSVRDLDAGILDAIERNVEIIGRWLRKYNYLGTFGVDLLLHRGLVLFTEVNARFQGSTHASSQLSGEAGESCVILDHLAAILGRSAPRRRPLREAMAETPSFAHLVIHWTGETRLLDTGPLTAALRELPGVCRVDVAAKPGVKVAKGGVAARVATRDRMTSDGYSLTPRWQEAATKVPVLLSGAAERTEGSEDTEWQLRH